VRGHGITFDYVKDALLKGRNILVFFATLVLLGVLPFPEGMPIKTDQLQIGGSLLIYAVFAAQTVFDAKFRASYNAKKTDAEIRAAQSAMHAQARNMRRQLDHIYDQRLATVLRETDEAAGSYFNGEKNEIKQRIAQKSISLASMYMKLLDVYHKRARASHTEQISFLARRINTNTSNLNNVRDPAIADEIRRVIETDEKMITTLKGERSELDKLDARLQYMESTVSMLKYNAVSNLESDELLRSLEADVDEAAAINAVLTDRQEEARGGYRLRL